MLTIYCILKPPKVENCSRNEIDTPRIMAYDIGLDLITIIIITYFIKIQMWQYTTLVSISNNKTCSKLKTKKHPN